MVEIDPTATSTEKRQPLGRRRPIIITLLCMMGFIGFPFTVMQLSDPVIKDEIISNSGELHYKINILSACLFLVAYIGYWMMKRWGVILCTILTIAMIVYLNNSGLELIRVLLRCGQATVIVFMGFAYFKKMDNF